MRTTGLPLRESDIRRQVQDYLRVKGWFVFYILQGGVGVYRGISDLIAVKNGRVVFLEIKRPGGRQSAQQLKFQADLEAAGGEYILCRGIEDLAERGI